MTVLVAAASRHGATAEIAERVGAGLSHFGLDVEVKKVGEVRDIGRYEAVVLGSAIYFGAWMRQARRFVGAHRAELAARPTWLFASGSVTGHPPMADDPRAVREKLVQDLVEATNAREHKLFAGKLDRSKLGFAERAAVRAARASDGDHRDWDAVDDWAATIGRELQHGSVS